MKLTNEQTKKLLKASYQNILVDVDEFKIDKSLSSYRVKVYTVDGENDVIVVHRGTKDNKDWYDNFKYGMNLDPTYSKTFKIHQKRHKRAVDKYGADNIISIGHSRGAIYANKLHRMGLSRYNINLNKPINANDFLFEKPQDNQTNLKSSLDPVSILQPNDKSSVVIKSKTIDPVKEHSRKVLNYLPDEQILGGSLFFNSIDFKKIRVKQLKDFIKKNKKYVNEKLNITKKPKKILIEIVKKILNEKNK